MAWRKWILPVLLGGLGVVLALGAIRGYVTYQEHQAILGWANNAEMRLRKLEAPPASVPAPAPQVPKK